MRQVIGGGGAPALRSGTERGVNPSRSTLSVERNKATLELELCVLYPGTVPVDGVTV